jgi:hypothetical protein
MRPRLQAAELIQSHQWWIFECGQNVPLQGMDQTIKAEN